MNRKKIDAVLFDFDGTLQVGDKDELHARLTEITSQMNLGFTDEEIFNFGNRSDYREMFALMVNNYNQHHPDTPITGDEFEAVNKEVSGMFDDKFRLADGVIEVLDKLRSAGKRIGLVTTRGPLSLPRILERYGISDYFDVIVNRKDVERTKPHPEPVLKALEKLGVEDPSTVVFVGDLQDDDVRAGLTAGVKTVLVSEKPLDPYGAKPTHHFTSLVPIKRHFGR